MIIVPISRKGIFANSAHGMCARANPNMFYSLLFYICIDCVAQKKNTYIGGHSPDSQEDADAMITTGMIVRFARVCLCVWVLKVRRLNAIYRLLAQRYGNSPGEKKGGWYGCAAKVSCVPCKSPITLPDGVFQSFSLALRTEITHKYRSLSIVSANTDTHTHTQKQWHIKPPNNTIADNGAKKKRRTSLPFSCGAVRRLSLSLFFARRISRDSIDIKLSKRLTRGQRNMFIMTTHLDACVMCVCVCRPTECCCV